MKSLTNANWKAARRRLRLSLEIAALGLLAFFVMRMIGSRFGFPGWLFGPTYAAVSTTCPGDINLDGQRDIRDLTLLQAHVSGKQLLSGARLDAADVNGDGKVDVLDVVALQQHVTHQKLLADCRATMTVSPAALDFGSVTVGQNKDLTVTVTNVGSAALAVSSISSGNPNFAVTAPVIPFNVAAGGQQAITVRFTPPAAGLQAGTLAIAATSGGVAMSASVTLSGTGVVANNPIPTTTSISPTSATAGDSALTLTVNGTNFVSGSVVQWEGSALATTFVSATQLKAAVPAANLIKDDTVSVAVSNPPPGGGLSGVQPFYIAPNGPPPRSAAYIRYIAPTRGQATGQFTLFGKGFDPTPAKNTVAFTLNSTDLAATVTSASSTALTGTAPATLQNGSIYSVTVAVNGIKTNAVSYEANSAAAQLVVRPSSPTLLMPPGTAKEYLVIGGGTPPYKLQPLSTDDQAKATVELKGNVVEVTGLSTGKFDATSIDIQVQDSAPRAATAGASVRIQKPIFSPTFDVVPHNLLPGSLPGFTLKIGTSYSEMKIERLKIKIQGVDGDFSLIKANTTFALTDSEGTYGVMQATEVSASKVNFVTKTRQALTLADDTGGRESIITSATGSLEKNSDGVTLTQLQQPVPPPEAVYNGGLDTEIYLADHVIQLPSQTGASFTVTATFTSVTLSEGKYAPMTKTVAKTFTTSAPVAGAPRIARLSPLLAAVGQTVEIDGSGFSGNPSDNKVSLVGDSEATRVEATVISSTPTRLTVTVPQDAPFAGGINGEQFRVTVGGANSNTYWFRTLFRPDGMVVFPSFKASTAVGPIIQIGQPSDRIAISTARITFDDGKLSTAALVKGQTVGSAQLATFGEDIQSEFVLVYDGQEASGPSRHIFSVKETPQSSAIAQLLAASNTGKGITIDFSLLQNTTLNGKTLLISFEKQIYSPPASAGATVNTVLDLQSGPWNFFAGGEMHVVFSGRAVTR